MARRCRERRRRGRQRDGRRLGDRRRRGRGDCGGRCRAVVVAAVVGVGVVAAVAVGAVVAGFDDGVGVDVVGTRVVAASAEGTMTVEARRRVLPRCQPLAQVGDFKSETSAASAARRQERRLDCGGMPSPARLLTKQTSLSRLLALQPPLRLPLLPWPRAPQPLKTSLWAARTPTPLLSAQLKPRSWHLPRRTTMWPSTLQGLPPDGGCGPRWPGEHTARLPAKAAQRASSTSAEDGGVLRCHPGLLRRVSDGRLPSTGMVAASGRDGAAGQEAPLACAARLPT